MIIFIENATTKVTYSTLAIHFGRIENQEIWNPEYGTETGSGAGTGQLLRAKLMEKLYNDDVNISVLNAQMEILQVLLKDGDYFCFDDIIVKIKELPNPEREMIKEVITLCKLILVNPANSAAGERSFFDCPEAKNMAPLKNQPGRNSSLTVLNMHKERTDRLSTIDIANVFTDHNTNKKRNFGTFRVNDVL